MRLLAQFLVVIVLLAAQRLTQAQMIDALPIEEELADSLIGTTWSGTAFEQDFDFYFLSNNILVYRTKGTVYNKSKWHIRNNRISVTLLNNPQFRLQADLEGDRKGDQISGTAKNLLKTRYGQVGPGAYGSIHETEDSPWLLKKLATPIPELVAAAPENEAPQGEPSVTRVSEFEGFFSAQLPPEGNGTAPTNFSARCDVAIGCMVKTDGLPGELFDRVTHLNSKVTSQAKFALRYARDHREKAIELEPWLAPLLNSSADISACLNLGRIKPNYSGGGTPGRNILCRLNNSPFREPVVLYMGTILANCGPAFCRFGIMPLFAKQGRNP